MLRSYFALEKGFKRRLALGSYLINKELQLDTLLMLSPNAFKSLNIKALILDFDGVLNSHGESEVHPELIQWLKDASQILGSNRIFILSNNPISRRINYFKTHFPEISFVVSKNKKPYPEGIESIIQLSNLVPKEILMIDDRLATGILAAELAGTRALLISDPYINFSKRPIQEAFFYCLRTIERRIFKYCVLNKAIK
ncbi:MAG: Hydrolase, subfamily [Francisellaceae bacterium]|nr:Hydrolase, subfamily [Francisellaceae bacterium]